MAEWRKKHPEANWESSDDAPRLADAKSGGGGFLGLFGKDEAKEPAAAPAKEATPAAPEPAAKPGAVQDGHTYGSFGERDQKIWQAATQEFVKKGDQIFHDAKALGGTIAVSCDMCHPNASNTHPETYPKFQVQLGRVALLRDMINWCIQNPVRGKPLDDNDVRLKALEAYILAERKGVPLDFGKH
jgi:cytochrome c